MAHCHLRSGRECVAVGGGIPLSTLEALGGATCVGSMPHEPLGAGRWQLLRNCTTGSLGCPWRAAVVVSAYVWQRFAHLNIDLVGPLLTTASGFRYVLTIV